MKKILLIALAALAMVCCAPSDDSVSLEEKYGIETRHVTDNVHVYTIWKTPNRYIGVEHDPECACPDNGGSHRPADSMLTYASDEEIEARSMDYEGHDVMVFMSGGTPFGTVHSPECPCLKEAETGDDSDPWNTEIKIEW